MKLTKQQSSENRKKIVDTAAYLFRKKGFNGISVLDLMKAAGFTHGGFYNRFSSKDALAEEACRASFETYIARLAASLDASPDLFVSSIQAYLSTSHRDDPGNGCPTASLVADAPTQSAGVQSAFADGINGYARIFDKQWLAEPTNGSTPEQKARARGQSLRLISELVGAMLLSRAVQKHASDLSQEILRASRNHIPDLTHPVNKTP